MKIKAFLGIILCLCLVLCFVACSDVPGAGGSSNKPGQSSTVESTSGQDSTEESVPSQDSTDESTPSQDSMVESTPSQDSTGESVPSQDSTVESTPSQDSTDESTPSQDSTDEGKPDSGDKDEEYVTVTFDANGATNGTTDEMTAKVGEKITLNLNGFEREGYTFVGWSTTEDGEVEYQDGAEYTMGTESSYTLYAVWEINTYTVTYEKNGGTGDVTESFTIDDLPLKLKDLDNKENYLFNYWYFESDFSGEPVFEIAELGNVTLYAEYVEGTDGLVIDNDIVIGYEGSKTDVVIPKEYKRRDITKIGFYAFANCESLTSVTIPQGVTTIYDSAFGNCRSLIEVTVPQSVTAINDGAFANCKSLMKVTIPDGVTEICSETFKDCMSLTSVTIPSSVTRISSYAFSGCINLISVTMGDNVASIDRYAFDYCISLANITIPKSVKTIEKGAFFYCRNLTDITIGEGVEKIYSDAFYGCSGLMSLTVLGTVLTIEDKAFDNCGAMTVYCQATETQCEMSNYWNNLGNPVVWDCKNNNVASDGCVYLVVDGVRYALKDGEASVACQPGNVYDMNILSCVSYEGQEYKVTKINQDAFDYGNNLISITIPESVTTVYRSTFRGCFNATLYCEAPSKPSEWPSRLSIFGPVVWDYKNNDATSSGVVLVAIDGIRYGLKDNEATVYYQPKDLVEVNIPSSVSYKGKEYKVTGIIDVAFKNCELLTKITIPKGVTSIGSSAFYNCRSLTNVNIPEGVTTIESSTFSDCISLTSVTIPNSVTAIKNNAFDSCESLTSITLPEGVTSIGNSAFWECYKLERIKIPMGVTSIGDRAFEYCYILTIYCEAEGQPSGWDEDWNSSSCPVVWGWKEN